MWLPILEHPIAGPFVVLLLGTGFGWLLWHYYYMSQTGEKARDFDYEAKFQFSARLPSEELRGRIVAYVLNAGYRFVFFDDQAGALYFASPYRFGNPGSLHRITLREQAGSVQVEVAAAKRTGMSPGLFMRYNHNHIAQGLKFALAAPKA